MDDRFARSSSRSRCRSRTRGAGRGPGRRWQRGEGPRALGRRRTNRSTGTRVRQPAAARRSGHPAARRCARPGRIQRPARAEAEPDLLVRSGRAHARPGPVRPDHPGRPRRVRRCSVAGRIGSEPYYSGCRWRTRRVLVAHNYFVVHRSRIRRRAPGRSCGLQGIFSNWAAIRRGPPTRMSGSSARSRSIRATCSATTPTSGAGGSWRATRAACWASGHGARRRTARIGAAPCAGRAELSAVHPGIVGRGVTTGIDATSGGVAQGRAIAVVVPDVLVLTPVPRVRTVVPDAAVHRYLRGRT
jgi:hypothetical protein